jgi:hypothetical protein
MLAGHLDRLDEISINVSDRDNDSHSESLSKSDKSGGSVNDSSMTDSNHTGGGSSGTSREKAEAEILAEKVSKHVFWFKMTVLLVLLCATVLVSAAMYWSTAQSEVSAFESATSHHISKILDSVRLQMGRKLGAIDSFSVAITSLARDTNVSWPMITVADFEYRAANVREMASASAIAFLPLVTSKTRAKWEAYAMQTTDWMENAELLEQSLLFQTHPTTTTTTTTNNNNNNNAGSSRRRRTRRVPPNDQKEEDDDEQRPQVTTNHQPQEQDTMMTTTTTTTQTHRSLQIPASINGVSSSIFHLDENGIKEELETTTGKVYFPMWEQSPLDRNLINYNLLMDPLFETGINAMLSSKHAVLGQVWNVDDQSKSSDFLQKWQVRDSAAAVHQGLDPVSKILYPVYDTLQDNHDVVAMLVTIVHWDQLFELILPPHANGLICVISNECGQVFTYAIHGETSEFLGYEDSHDAHYDYLSASATFADIIQNKDHRVERFADVGFNVEYCPYKIHVYPSKDLEDAFITKNPLVYTISVVAIFAFTAMIFLIYDWIVERRQTLVMKRAVQSRAIVSVRRRTK